MVSGYIIENYDVWQTQHLFCKVIYNDSVVLKTFEQLIYINSYQGLLQDFLVGGRILVCSSAPKLEGCGGMLT